MSKLNSLKPGALAAVLLIGCVPAARAAAALEQTSKPEAAGQSETCLVTDAQRQEMAAIRKEVGDLGAARAPLGERVNATLVRIDRLSHELTRCLEPQIKSMIAQAGSGPSPELVERVRTTAVRLASGETMTDEERSRLTEQLASDTAKLRSETGPRAADSKELQEQNRIFNINMNGNVGIALRELDKAKHELLRLRG
jgi:hypothetical protein